VTFTNTTIRFFHTLTDTIALIGFEIARNHTKFKDGLGGLRSLDL